MKTSDTNILWAKLANQYFTSELLFLTIFTISDIIIQCPYNKYKNILKRVTGKALFLKLILKIMVG